MNNQKKEERHMLDEADIGSGEITPGQNDTDKLIEQVGKKKRNQNREKYGVIEERDMLEEADIGSGEITPGQEDTDKIIEQIGKNRKKQAKEKDRTKDERSQQ